MTNWFTSLSLPVSQKELLYSLRVKSSSARYFCAQMVRDPFELNAEMASEKRTSVLTLNAAKVRAFAAAVVVGIIAQDMLGSIGGMVAVLGVIVLAITSGDTALRSLRLMIGDALHIDQRKKINAFTLAFMLFAIVAGVLYYAKTDKSGFALLWRYFSWANETIAVFAFAMIAVYMIKNGMPKCMHFLGLVYCFFGTVAVFGIGNTSQVNTIIGAIDTSFITMIGVRKLISHLLIGVILALLIFRVFYQGPGNIGNLTAKLVPFAAGSYILLSVTALLINFDRLPNAFLAIIHGAFEPSAVTGGIIGSVLLTMRTGISRGVFTNEAGMGTASIAHSESSEADPVRQGLLGITEVFFDTIVICTLTALVILSSDIAVPYGYDTGITLTTNAFTSIFGDWCGIVISVITVLLAFATILGWGLYGMRCAQYIFGESVWRVFPALQAAATFLGACINTSTAWVFSELVNAFMVLTNLIAVTYLLPEFLREIKAHRL